jgi:hopanoid biosynthesis associated protein HpnK
MVAEPASLDGVARARDYPNLDVGLHLVCCNGRSVLPPHQLRGIVDDAGSFPRSEVRASLRYAFRRGVLDKLRAEFRAQFERHLSVVGYLNHVNGHHNLHLHPALIDIVLDLASEYRVPYVRLVREPVLTTLALARDHSARKLRDHVVFRWASARARRRMTSRQIGANDLTFGFHQTGRLTEGYVLGVLARLRNKTVTEFYFHPAMDPADGTQTRKKQATEVQILTGTNVRAALARFNITLTSFRELAGRRAGDPAHPPGPGIFAT